NETLSVLVNATFSLTFVVNGNDYTFKSTNVSVDTGSGTVYVTFSLVGDSSQLNRLQNDLISLGDTSASKAVATTMTVNTQNATYTFKSGDGLDFVVMLFDAVTKK